MPSELDVLEQRLASSQGAHSRFAALLELSTLINETDARRAIDMANEALGIATSIGDQGLIAEASCTLGHALQHSGDYPNAVTHYETAVQLFATHGPSERYAFALYYLGGCHSLLYRPDEAMHYIDMAHDIFQSIDHRYGIAKSMQGKSLTLRVTGKLEGAIRLSEAAADILRTLPAGRQALGYVLLNTASMYEDLDVPLDGLAHVEEALGIADQIHSDRLRGYLIGQLGWIRAVQGNWSEAKQLFEECLSIAKRVDDRALVAWGNYYHARMFDLQGNVETAVRLYALSADLCQELDIPECGVRCHEKLAMIFEDRGDTSRAWVHYRRFNDLKGHLLSRGSQGKRKHAS